MFSEHISAEVILFFILYGITGVVPLIAAVYLLLRRGNAFASDVTPPLRLRRWAASFFAVAALGHVWWLLFYIFSGDIHSVDDVFLSVGYIAAVVLDSVTLLTTIAGTLLAMLQDRKRPVWPVFSAMIPFVVLGGVLMVYPSERLMQIAFAYIVLLYVLFSVYVAFAVRQYGRWLRDNYADLEHKEVWQSIMVLAVIMLGFGIYTSEIGGLANKYIVQVNNILLICYLLWRVETLSDLSSSIQTDTIITTNDAEEKTDTIENNGLSLTVNSNIGSLLKRYCEEPQLYLLHDISAMQLAMKIGTNRVYLSKYFASQGITYSIYINGLRIQHFINLYHEAVATHQPITVRQLAHKSGFHSYSTFNAAFKQIMGMTATEWMHASEL